MDRFSGCAYDPASKSYLLLVKGDQPQVLAMNDKGEIIGNVDLPDRNEGGAPQYEGIVVARNGDIIVTSEPYLYIKLTLN